jgi:xanthosine utilization system XapX-like protein
VAILVLLLGASLIYAVGGGFSLDSRKKYPLLPLTAVVGVLGISICVQEASSVASRISGVRSNYMRRCGNDDVAGCGYLEI